MTHWVKRPVSFRGVSGVVGKVVHQENEARGSGGYLSVRLTGNVGNYRVYLSVRVNVLGFLVHEPMVSIQRVNDDAGAVNVHWARP